MSEVKVILNMVVPGAVMMSEKECEESPLDNYNYEKLEIVTADRNNKKPKREVLSFRTRKCKNATRSISISNEAYEDMISDKIEVDCPTLKREYNSFKWKRLTKTQRLKAHLQVIADNFNAISFTYDILDN